MNTHLSPIRQRIEMLEKEQKSLPFIDSWIGLEIGIKICQHDLEIAEHKEYDRIMKEQNEPK